MTELSDELRSLREELKALRESLNDFKEHSRNTIHLRALTMMFMLIFVLVGSIKLTESAVMKLPEILGNFK